MAIRLEVCLYQHNINSSSWLFYWNTNE